MKTDGLLISSIPNIIYYTGYSGFSESEREAFLIIKNENKILLTDSRYIEEVKNLKGIEAIECPAGRFLQDGKEILESLKIKTLEIEENDISAYEYKQLTKFAKVFPANLENLREIKSDEEIKNIKKACQIGDKAFKYIIKQLKVNKTEKEIAIELEFFIKRQKGDISFKPIIAFGKNSAVPHHQSDETRLKKNQIVLMDFGVKVNNYCSDMTRTVFFGTANKEFKDMYKVVLEAQQNAIKSIKIGIKTSEIDKISRDYITSNNFPNIIHAVGHGIGIEVHESPTLSPNSKEIVKNGMVFSIEPGIYLSNFGGVRIEDLVLVRGGYAELISHSKREIIEVNV